MNIALLATRSPKLLAALLATAAVWGVLAFRSLPRQEEPLLTWRLANVVTRLPGASPGRVESQITDVLEQYIQQVDEVHHIYSVSRAGVSLVQVELNEEVTRAGPVWQKVRHKLGEAAAELPPGTIGPELDDEILGTTTVLVAISGDAARYSELESHAERLETQLRYLPATASTNLFGVQDEVIEVCPDAARLAAYDLSFDAVAAAIRRRNVQSPSGRLSTGEGEWLLDVRGEFDAEDEIASLIVLANQHHTLRLGDVAAVYRTTRSPPDPLARCDGRRSIIVAARARSAARIDAYSDQVKSVLNEFRGTLPDDIHCTLAHDLGRYTSERINQLGATLLLSVALVLLCTAALMDLRAASVVTLSIPLTGLFVLLGFSLARIPLNEMSIMAIVMALGLLVDNSIVLTEQIHRRASEGIPLKQAAAEEPHRLLAPLLVSTLTTIAAFVPIWLLPGGVGEFVRAIPVGVTICLATSLVVALVVTPWLCTLLLRPTGHPERLPVPGARQSAWLGRFSRLAHRRLLWRAVSRPAIVLATIAVLAAGLLSLGLGLRRDFFSPVQRDQLVIDLVVPQGSSLAHTDELVQQVERALRDEQDVNGVLAFIGRNAPLIFYNLTSQETYANHFAQLIVTVSDWRKTAPLAARLQSRLDETISGADCCVRILEHGAPFAAPLEVRIRGRSIEILRRLGSLVQQSLAETPGIRNIRTNFGAEALKLRIDVNEPVARAVNLDQQAVSDALRGRMDGLPAGHFYHDQHNNQEEERVDVLVRLPPGGRRGLADLWNIHFKPSAQGPFVPFGSVADAAPEWETASIYRRDSERTLSVLAYPQFGLTAAQVSRRLLPRLEALAADLPAGYTLELGGENEQRHEAESNLLGSAPYAIGLIVVVLMAQFQRWRLVIVILGVMPLSLAGAMAALMVTGWPLNFMAMLGMIMLIGVVVNDSVILVDGYERRRRAGQSLRRRTLAGTRERFRHVVITTITTIAAFLPLALSPSLLWPPLAIAVIGGLSLATALTLVAVPAAYVLLCRHEDGRPRD